jgi:hypothetical protein
MKFNLSGKEVAEFQGSMMLASEDEVPAIIEDYAERLVQRAAPEDTHGPGLPFGRETARSLLGSLKPVSKEVYSERLSCCSKCEHVKVLKSSHDVTRPGVYQCGLCLCIMNAKAMVIGGKCPDGRF